ncbi:MAG: hypothetical protein OCC45_13075 [Desulfotalea sp.]
MDSIEYNAPKNTHNFYNNRTNRHIARIGYGLLKLNKSKDKVKTTEVSKLNLANAYRQASTIEIKKSSNKNCL